MKRETFDAIVNDTMGKTAKLLISKGSEYANDSDRLANFKRNAEKQGTTPLQIWKQYYGKHIDSIDSYFQRIHDRALELAIVEASKDSTKQTGPVFRALIAENLPLAMMQIDDKLSEPIEGRFHDVINYCLLGLALLSEARDSHQEG